MTDSRVQSKRAERTDRRAGVVLFWRAQFNGAVQIEVVRFCCETKHVEAVVNGGTFSVAARLPGALQKGDGLVIHAPA